MIRPVTKSRPFIINKKSAETNRRLRRNINAVFELKRLLLLRKNSTPVYKRRNSKQFGKMAYITKAVAQLMRDLGSIQAPQNAFLINIGLETLALRMKRHCENALAVAEYLSKHPKVTWVNYPDLPGNKYYDLAKKYMPNGTCGVVSFGIKGGREAATRFMDSLKLAAIVTHVADAHTCVLHPASTTHRQLTDKQLEECKTPADLVRFSVGIEDAEDIIADLAQALDRA